MSSDKTEAPKMDQDGKMINPHNPEFITKVPWYLGSNGEPTLKHHAIQKADHFLSVSESDDLINRKLQAQREAAKNASRTVYKKGACKNCGAMTHKEKDCVERPRSLKKSAAKSGLDIAADEVNLDLEKFGKVSYATKRDQWKGYDPREYEEIVQKHNRMEKERQEQQRMAKEVKRARDEERAKQKAEEKAKRKAEKKALRQRALDGKHAEKATSDAAEAARDAAHRSDGDEDEDNDDDSDASDSDSDSDYGSDASADDDENSDLRASDGQLKDFQGEFVPQGGVGGAGMRVTVRNLRLREDTPKYLRNLALDSAFYDPKSRSMRNNPLPDENPEDLAFAGDNFVRHSGDALKLAANQVLCWEMQSRGEDIDMLTNPSQAELFQKQFKEKKEKLESEKQKAILDKYLDGKTNKKMDPRLKLGQTEVFLEYGKDGRVKKNTINAQEVRTKYEEDVFINNHTSVWGSYYNRAREMWGYRCCHSLMRNAYCTGQLGREANDNIAGNAAVDPFQARRLMAMKDEKEQAEALKSNSSSSSSSSTTLGAAAAAKRTDVFGESSASAALLLDEKKLKEAQKRAEEWNKKDHSAESDDRKRGYNSMVSVDTSVEDMEAYRQKRVKGDDPMAKLLDSDTVLDYK